MADEAVHLAILLVEQGRQLEGALAGEAVDDDSADRRRLERRVHDRSEKGGIGFAAEVRSKDNKLSASEVLTNLEADDLIQYGLIPEFVGRLPVVATLQELDEQALVSILTEPKNALTKQYAKLFEMEGAEIEFRDDALCAVARKAMERKTGARGLRTILEHVLLNIMYELPSLENVRKVVVDERAIDGESEPYLVYDSELEQRTASD